MPGAKLDADQRASLARTALNSARLANELIGDLLDVAKLEAGKGSIEREPVDLLAIAGSCLEYQRPVATTKGLQLVLEAP
jgi:signal transduction histidine kinase